MSVQNNNYTISLAPMEGITTFVFRNCINKFYGGIDEFYTPFLTEKHFGQKSLRELIPEHNKDLKLVPQVMANSADITLAIADQLADYGYTTMNINLGCPSKTVVTKKHGSGMLYDLGLLERYLDEVFEKSPLKVSIKTRIGFESLSEWEDILSIYQKYPIEKLIIHPRLSKEFYQPVIHPEMITEAISILREASSDIPIVYNGDVTSIDTFSGKMKCFPEISSCMIGRGLLFCPSLAKDIKTFCEAENSNMTSDTISSLSKEELLTFRSFLDALLLSYQEDMKGTERPILEKMKELWAYFYRYLSLSEKELKEIRKSKNLSEYKLILNAIFSRRL